MADKMGISSRVHCPESATTIWGRSEHIILRSSQARGAASQVSLHTEGEMDGRTALALAAVNGHEAVAKLLQPKSLLTVPI
jgi:hypothetical protein